jgi:hypothetical protein
MSYSDAFALKNSGLNEFLFAEVGTEVNGSPLTILSVLARLGRDPWAEAGGWTKLPKATTVDRLADCISRMPLCPQALADARATATRLVQLLPSQAQPVRGSVSAARRKSMVPGWIPIAVFFAAIVFAIAFEMMPSTARIEAVTPLTDPATQHPRARTN